MRTCAAYTNEILNGYLMDNNELNIGYFADEVICTAENDNNLYFERLNTRRKPRNIAINEMMAYINKMLSFHGYRDFYASNKQVMQWDRAHNGGLEAALDIIEESVKTTRAEAQA